MTRWCSINDPGEVFGRHIAWHPSGMPAPLGIDLPGLFTEAVS